MPKSWIDIDEDGEEEQEDLLKNGKGAEPGTSEGEPVQDTEHHASDGERLPSAIDEISNMLWTLQVGDGGQTSFQGPSGNLCFPQSTEQKSGTQHVRADAPYLDVTRQNWVHDPGLNQSLVDLYMEHVNPYHFFIEDLPNVAMLTESDTPLQLRFLQATILAAGALYANDAQTVLAGQAFEVYAENIALKCCRDCPSLGVLRGLAILSWLELSHGNDNMGWMYNCMAASLALHLGLHVIGLSELQGSQAISLESRLSRIRAFWSFFLLDRMATSLLGRNCALPWRRVRVPALDLGGPLIEAERAFTLQCRLWYLHDQYMDQIYAFEFVDLDVSGQSKLLLNARDALLTFRTTIVEQFPINAQEPNKHACLLHLSYQMSLTLIHRPFLRESHDRQTRHLALRSITASADAFARLIKILKRSFDISRMPFFLVHHVLTAAVSHLFNATTSSPRLRRMSVSGVRVCIEALEELRKTWQVRASHAIHVVQELAARWKVVSALPIHLSYPLQAGPVCPVDTMPNEQVNDRDFGSFPDSFGLWSFEEFLADHTHDLSLLDTIDNFLPNCD